jgi:transglutaminase-like putative cysteine protease
MAETDRAVGTRNTDYAQALALAALLAGASLSLSRLYTSAGWLVPVWLTMAVALGLAALLRRAGAGQLVSLVAMVAGFVVVAALLLFQDTLFLIVPTPATLVAMGRAYTTALQAMSDQAAPVEVTKEFLFLTCAGAWAVAMAADGLTFRARQPLLALVPALGLFVFPALIHQGGAGWYTTWFLIGVAVLLLTEGRARLATWGRWVSSPRSRPAVGWRLPLTPAASTGRWLALSAGIVALAVPWLLPGYGKPPAIDYKSGPRATPNFALNPFTSMKTRLTSQADEPAFEVQTNSPTYWRLMVADRWDGNRFIPSELNSQTPFSGSSAGDISAGIATTAVQQKFTVQRFSGASGSDMFVLPTATAPVSVRGAGKTYQSRTNLDVWVKGSVHTGLKYTVISQVAHPSANDLEGPIDYANIPGLQQYLDTGGIDQQVAGLAKSITTGRKTPFQRALALQDYLLNPKLFHYSLNVPQLASGGDQLRRFLTEVRTGYCEQFANAFALMARINGIPARVAIGFTSGLAAGDHYEITGKDSHAWPELYFPKVGWVRFEPTPRGDGQVELPFYSTPEGRQVVTSTTVPGNNTTGSTTAQSGTPAKTEPLQNESTPSSGTTHHGLTFPQKVLIGALVVLLLVALVPAGKLTRDLVARRRARRLPRDAVAAAYGEVTAWAGDAGIGRRAAETPAAYAERLRERFAADADPLAELTRLFEWAEYAPTPPAIEQALAAHRLARSARSRLGARLGWRRRAAATLSPRSLLISPDDHARPLAGAGAGNGNGRR